MSSIFKLRREIVDRIQRGAGPWTSKNWNQLARQVFAYQAKHNVVFKKFLTSFPSRAPFPTLPIVAFKESKVCSFRPSRHQPYFESSGTTNAGTAIVSRHHFRSLDLYETSVIAGWRWKMCHQTVDGLGEAVTGSPTPSIANGMHRIPHSLFHNRFIALMPSEKEAPHSSLSKMVAILMKKFGDDSSAWFMQNGRWKWPKLKRQLTYLEQNGQQSVLFGTAFAWVHFLDWCAAHKVRFSLPSNTTVLETGGYKGKSRELTRSELHQQLSKLLGLPKQNIQSEYSMCELSSQAYSFSVRGKTLFQFPPWCRYRVVRPGSSQSAKKGEQGVLEIYDLANFDSCAFIRTEDMAIDHGKAFELLGRLPRAGLKGCSLSFE
jgi:hypothetical protein